MEQNKAKTIQFATEIVIKEMSMKNLDKTNKSEHYRKRLHETIIKTADKYQLKSMTLIRIFK